MATSKKPKKVLIKELKNETWKKVKTDGGTKKMNYMLSSHGRIKSVNKKTKDEPVSYTHLTLPTIYSV